MAKTAKLKHHPATLHSRASRRASPSLNLDKSLTSLKPPSRKAPPSLLSTQHNSGITKSSKKGGKVLKRKQKMRLDLGKERAEARMEKMEVKIERVGRRREGVRGRNREWEDVNGGAERRGGKKGKNKNGERGDQEEDGWEDEGEDGVVLGVEGKEGVVDKENKYEEGGMDVELGDNVDKEM